MEARGTSTRSRLTRLAMIGCSPVDDDATRLRKSALVLSCATITTLATAWVVI